MSVPPGYLIIKPTGKLSPGIMVSLGLPRASGMHSFDSRIGRQIDEAAERFFSFDPALHLSSEPTLNQIAKMVSYLRSSHGTPSYFVDELRASYRAGAAWLNQHLPESRHVKLRKVWDEIYVLSNLASDVSVLMLNDRMRHAARYSLCFVESSAPSGLAAIASFELRSNGAEAAKLPYLRNIWSGTPGYGTELLRYVRDCSGSPAILVKPLSAALEDYYRRSHEGYSAPRQDIAPGFIDS